MTEIYLIRHAEAEGNIYRRAHGQYNSLLTPNGHRQLQKLAEWFRTRKADAVYSSDLYRAKTSAQAVADVFGLPVTTTPELREIALGNWEDRTWGDIAYREGDMLQRFNRDKDFVVPGGESYGDAAARIIDAVSKIARRHDGQTVVITAHGCVIKYYLDSVAKQPLPHLDNASVSLVRITDGTPNIVFAGENEFLGELSTFLGQSWWRGIRESEFWFNPVVLSKDEDEICRYGIDCWQSVYNTKEGFDVPFFLKSCRESSRQNRRFLQIVMDNETPVGFFQMRAQGGISSQDGHIGMIYLEKACRGKGFGVQLLGEAISLSRALRKPGVSLRVWEKNLGALRFYQKAGFTVVGQEDGLYGSLLLMRKDILVN